MGAIFSEFIEALLNEKWQFIAILIVVVFDFIIGAAKAIKDGVGFKTEKVLKTLIKMVVFWALLATVLSLEKGFPYASFLSEAIILPIMVLQLIKPIKKIQQMGYINSETAEKILSNIDKHKNPIKHSNTSEKIIPEVD